MNISERKKTTKILQEWKNFINEEKESKIKTIGDLKIALTLMVLFVLLFFWLPMNNGIKHQDCWLFLEHLLPFLGQP